MGKITSLTGEEFELDCNPGQVLYIEKAVAKKVAYA